MLMMPVMVCCRRVLVLSSFLLLHAQGAACQTVHAPAAHHRTAKSANPESKTAAAFERARQAGPEELGAFLTRMPKGADLHMHLSGAVYAETFLKDAADDQLCLDPATHTLLRPADRNAPPSAPGTAAACARGMLPAAQVFHDQDLYDGMVDAFSMRGFVPTAGVTGHDQFFSTFKRFDAPSERHFGEWLDEVATRAAAQNEQYLEIMKTPPFSHAAALGERFGWPQDAGDAYRTGAATTVPMASAGTSRAELSALRDKLLAAGLRDELAADRAQIADGLAGRRALEHCGEINATPACAVEVRFLYQVLRGFPPQRVFAQTLLGFEVASADPNVVGINFVMPEDGYLSMSEYHRQMLMLDYLHSVYPQVHITLHAGELAPGLVPPAGLRFHIREAVDLGHAERIGHGVDVEHETDAALLLREMADRHVMVEMNLTSNDVILGVTPATSPLPVYRAAQVPVALSTDDEGVSRIDLTHEYVRAALEFQLSYLDLKQMARTSLEHSFLPGTSLWQRVDDFTAMNAACTGQTVGAEQPGAACASFLSANRRAAQQWELEHRFHIFEAAN